MQADLPGACQAAVGRPDGKVTCSCLDLDREGRRSWAAGAGEGKESGKGAQGGSHGVPRRAADGERPGSAAGRSPRQEALLRAPGGGGRRRSAARGSTRAAGGTGGAPPCREEGAWRGGGGRGSAMTLPVFFGCACIAFGPPLALFLLTVVAEPLRVIILIAGAFFWLASLLLSALVWFVAAAAGGAAGRPDEALRTGLLVLGVLCSVLLQEAFRFLYYKLLRKAVEGLVALSEDGCSPVSIRQMAYVAGLGFGLMSGAFSMINLLADAMGPGTVGIHGDSQLYFLTSAFMTLVLILLHTFWGIIFFHGCESRRWWEVGTVVLTHLIVSVLTFWNPLYLGSLLPAYLLMGAAAVWAYILSGGSKQNLRRFLLCLRSGTMPPPVS